MSNKIIKRELRQSISKISKNLGQGLIDPVPYDTAWVARVPLAEDLSRPAFPLSLHWLRVHQLENGSWGTDKPFSAHSSTLNTLAAIIALAQWNNTEDKDRIKSGIGALWDLAPLLQSENHAGVGFELILPALETEARIYELPIPYEYYKSYDKKAKKKLNLIMTDFKEGTEQGHCKPATWWHNLEMLGPHSENYFNENMLQFSLSMLTDSGSVGESPSATAYVLRAQRIKGVDVPEAENYLRKVYLLQKGGIPQVFSIDIFELAFSLDFFIKAGYSMQSPGLKEAAYRLSQRCNPRDSIGFASNLKIPDSDDTAVALYVLHRAGYEVSIDDLLRFANETHLSTFLGESDPSISANINALSILRIFRDIKEVNTVIQKIATFLETFAASKEHVFIDDKWHSSPYYCTSRAVFNLNGLKDDIVKRCLDFFVQSQNNDGGWGKHSFSTAEETAYVVLALCYALKYDYSIPKNVLQRAYLFLFGSRCNVDAQLWIGKVLYRPSLVAESAVLAARFALIKSLQLISEHSALNYVKPDFMEVELKYAGNQQGCRGTLLCTVPDFDIDMHSDQIGKVREQVIQKLMKLQLIKKGDKLVKSLTLEGCFFIIRKNEISNEHILFHALLSMAVLIYDDIVDKNWQLFRNNPDILKLVSLVLLDILKGKYRSIDKIKSLDFPKFIPLCKLFLDVRNGMIDKPNTNEFLREIEILFSCNIQDINNRINGLSLSSKQFLRIGKITSCFHVFSSARCMFEDVHLYCLNDRKLLDKFKDYAAKAARLALDIFSFPRDSKHPFENYVLVKQTELNCSVEDAFDETIKLFNKLQIKMINMKRKMQSNPSVRDNQNFLKAISVSESVQHGFLDWASSIRRYSEKTNSSALKIRKKFKDVNYSEFLRLFYD